MNIISRKIAIFDDDIAILDVFSMVFEAGGYEAHTFQNTQNIILKICDLQPDLVIMDNSIPNMGGINAVQAIKNEDQCKHIPIIFCSANSDISNLAAKAGADAYLSKPFNLDELERLVIEIMAKKLV